MFLDRLAEVQQADEALVVGDSHGCASLRGAQDFGSAPVGGEPAAVGGQQHDVGRAGGGVQVLLVLDLIAREGAGADDESRRPVELGGRLRPGGLLEALQRLRSDHSEAPGIGEVVVGGPASEVEDLLELLVVDRLGPVGLVGPPRADRLLDFHSGAG